MSGNRNQATGLIRLSLAISVLCAAAAICASRMSAQEACKPVSDDLKERLARYVQGRFGLDTQVAIPAILPVNGTCYRKVHFSSSAHYRSFELDLYLSPDLRFLSRDIFDTDSDTAEGVGQQTIAVPKPDNGRVPSIGPVGAPVTITVFSDFQCPFCKKAAALLSEQGLLSGKATSRVVYRHYPLAQHRWARSAAELAVCMQMQSDAAFWKLHNYFFQEQSRLDEEKLFASSLEIARGAGANVDEYRACAEAHGGKDTVDRDIEAGRAAGVRLTPTLFVNGHKIEGLPAAEQLQTVIRQLARNPVSVR